MAHDDFRRPLGVRRDPPTDAAPEQVAGHISGPATMSQRAALQLPAHPYLMAFTCADVFAMHAAVEAAVAGLTDSDRAPYPGLLTTRVKLAEAVDTLQRFGIEKPRRLDDIDIQPDAALPDVETLLADSRRYVIRLNTGNGVWQYLAVDGVRDTAGRSVVDDVALARRFTREEATTVAQGMPDFWPVIMQHTPAGWDRY